MKKDGGFAGFVNDTLSNLEDIIIEAQFCEAHVELIAVDLWTYYMPCKYLQAVFVH